MFERATSADPDFARAWSSLAAAHLTLPTYAEDPDLAHRGIAADFARKALELDPTLAEAHAVIGDVARSRNAWGEALSHYQRAIELEPNNPTGFLWYAEHLASVGEVSKSLEYALKSLELDPFNAGTNSVVGYAFAANEDYENALKYTRAASDLGHPWAIYDTVLLLIDIGDLEAASKIIETDLAALDDRYVVGFQKMRDAARNPEEVDAFLDWTRELLGDDPLTLALQHVRFGRIDDAATILTRMEMEGGDWMVMWLPFMHRLRQHPAFPVLLQRYGLVDYWDEHGWPESCTREGGATTCR